MQDNQITEEQLMDVVNQLVAKRQGLDDAAREVLKSQVKEELADAIDSAFVDALPIDCLKRMNALSEEENPSEEEFAAIMSDAKLDNKAIIDSAIRTYTEKFLSEGQ